VKSTIIFSLFTLSIFVGGFFAGSYIGIPKTLLCNSIKTRLVIMNMAKPAQTTIADRQLQELEESTYQRINKDKRALAEICI